MVELFHTPPRAKSDPAIPQDRPVYRILNEKGFFGPDDSLHPEGAIIVLYDTPNEDMEPLNALAVTALEDYLAGLEESERAVAKSNGKNFLGRRRNKEEMLADATENARRLESVGREGGVPLMGAKKSGQKRISKVGETQVPQMAAEKRRVETLAG